MTKQSPIWHDWIDAVFRPVIAFFAGLVLGYLAQLAEVKGWVFAAGFGVVLLVLLGLFLLVNQLFETTFRRFFEWVGWGGGIKPSKIKHTPHWFVRFGWVLGMILGVAAVFILPEEVLAWL